MDDATLSLVERSEALATKPIGASWMLPDATYADYRQHKTYVVNLCAKVRELDVELTRLQKQAALWREHFAAAEAMTLASLTESTGGMPKLVDANARLLRAYDALVAAGLIPSEYGYPFADENNNG